MHSLILTASISEADRAHSIYHALTVDEDLEAVRGKLSAIKARYEEHHRARPAKADEKVIRMVVGATFDGTTIDAGTFVNVGREALHGMHADFQRFVADFIDARLA